jgi:hypothetical protein
MLHFPDMHERHDTIADAHMDTFRWLLDTPQNGSSASSARSAISIEPELFATPDFDDNSANLNEARELFITWLQRGTGFFHISGKPGAGKSTLMKYICSHPQLSDHLASWSQGARLGLGQFFFWNHGTSAQKSLKGLLRGLLHSILEKNHKLIPTAFPELWERMLTHPSSRTLEYRDVKLGF